MFKNVAAKFIVFAFDTTTNAPKTGDAANITAYVSKDYGSVTVLADTSASEMDATNAPGYYLFDAAQGETNGDCLLVSGKSSTANIKVIGAPAVIYTRPTTGWLAPATAGRTLVVDASGLADANMVKAGPSGSGTAQTTGDIFARIGAPVGASISADIAGVQSDTNDIQTRLPASLGANGNMKADVRDAGGTAVSATAGLLDVNAARIGGTAQTTGQDIVAAIVAILYDTGTSGVKVASADITSIASAILGGTVTELGSVPAASPTVIQALALIYMALRNKLTVTSSAKTIHNDAGTALAAKALSDNGTTYTEAELA